MTTVRAMATTRRPPPARQQQQQQQQQQPQQQQQQQTKSASVSVRDAPPSPQVERVRRRGPPTNKLSPMVKRAWGTGDSTRTFVAIKSHVAARPSELSFEIGDVFLNVSEASGADSLLGEHEITGHRGIIPRHCVVQQDSPTLEEATDL